MQGRSSLLRGSTRTGRTPFSPFHIRLSANDWLFWGSERGVSVIRGYLVSLVAMVCHSVLCLSTRSSVWFGWPASAEDCSMGPPWSYADAPVCTELKLIGFGVLKFSFFVFRYTGHLSSKCFSGYLDDPM